MRSCSRRSPGRPAPPRCGEPLLQTAEDDTAPTDTFAQERCVGVRRERDAERAAQLREDWSPLVEVAAAQELVDRVTAQLQLFDTVRALGRDQVLPSRLRTPACVGQGVRPLLAQDTERGIVVAAKGHRGGV